MLVFFRIDQEAIERLGGRCSRCQSTDRLEIDHVDRRTKTMDFQAMAMASHPKFLTELARCQLLCLGCHAEKSKHHGDLKRIGAYNGRAKLSEDDVRAIRTLRHDGMSLGRIGKRFGVSKAQVLKIERGASWAHGS